MNKRQVSVGIGLSLGLWLSGAAQGFVVSNGGHTLEESLELSAHIDMGSHVVQPVQLISQTPLVQQVAYDARRHRFEDMGIALRAIGEQNSQPLLLEIVNDQYQCASSPRCCTRRLRWRPSTRDIATASKQGGGRLPGWIALAPASTVLSRESGSARGMWRVSRQTALLWTSISAWSCRNSRRFPWAEWGCRSSAAGRLPCW
ncbi:Uncharacterised protein [Edwardsiella ictaluri]|nr:Uncharacterised protein [Edwardsiella ictaluri]